MAHYINASMVKTCQRRYRIFPCQLFQFRFQRPFNQIIRFVFANLRLKNKSAKNSSALHKKKDKFFPPTLEFHYI